MTPAPTPGDRYRQQLTREGFKADPAQAAAVAHLDRIHAALSAPTPARRGLLAFWRNDPAPPDVRGLYLWGSVGRGKTMLVDLFHDCLPPVSRRRVHFHSFMRAVHAELKTLDGVVDPLQAVAQRWARGLRVLCLDEFHVTDITDAMLLGRLLKALFDRGVVLVTTSNDPPDQLYRGGLQRERFLPAIALLKERLEVVELTGAEDFRLRALTQAATYYTPADEPARAALCERWRALTQASLPRPATLDIEGRPLPVLAAADGVVWCDFGTLCGGPRGTHDYIELGLTHHTLFLSGIPVLGEDSNDEARRFINLIDELYDRSVKLLASADAPPAALYRGTRLAAPFRRTVSRLTEMGTHEYLAKPHLSR